jgi:hypothetical protein
MPFPILSRRRIVFCLVACACLAATACNSRKKTLEREQSGLKKLSVLYGQFLSQHGGQPPANKDEFKKFVTSLASGDSSSAGVDNPEKVFISDRDNKPYVVLYGKPKGPPGPAGSPVIAYEQEGKGGKRWVASALGALEEVDDARFQKLVPSAKP